MNKKYLLLLCFYLILFDVKAQPPVDLFNIQEVTLKNGIKVILFGKAHSIMDAKQVYPPSFKPPLISAAPMHKQFKLMQQLMINQPGKKVYPAFLGKTGDAVGAKDNEYYYLPANLRLSKRPDTGVPQFLFLKYVTDERDDHGGISGALVHFLMEWGLTEELRKECETILRTRVSGAKVVGPVMMQQADGESFSIISATVTKDNKDFTRSLITSGVAPLLPGQKIAAASSLTKYGSQLLAATFDKSTGTSGGQTSITDLSITLKYKYQGRIPACKGKVIINWSRIAKAIETYSSTKETTTAEKEGGGFFGWLGDKLFGKDEVVTNIKRTDGSNEISTSETNKTVQIQFEESYSDERITAIRDAFFKIIEDMISKALELDEEPLISTDAKATEEKQKAVTDALDAKSPNYQYYQQKIKEIAKRGQQTLDLSIGLMVSREYFITENLATWYNEVKDNKDCIATVVLGDKFYKRMDIRFVLDLEAKEMFDQEVNYVTVNVKKKRNSGNDFIDRRTIDKQYMTDKGITTSMTYAAGDDTNADMYEYMAQWSLRGGNVYPAAPQWEKGQMEAVTLRPPVSPRTIEFEADLEKLKSTGISRVTLQVRYKKFEQEMEENINVSPAQGQALASKMLFMDRDTRGYVYRLVFNHTTEGKLALPWSVKINDNYVYAVIPDELNNKTSELFIKAIDAAKTILAPGTDGKVTTDKVLDQFKEVLGAVKTN